MSIVEIRDDIDQIDRELVKLLERRMDAVAKVAQYKKETGKPVFDKTREREVLAQIASLVSNKAYEATIVATFCDVLANSREYQKLQLANSENQG
ncbi:MAG: chorismate mutase [Streptococcaceae bacterium]|nr:chorismate mutase [Streptococcaceae bacterium]